MLFKEILEGVGAIIVSLGGGAAVVWWVANMFGKLWVDRILEKDRAEYQTQIETFKNQGNELIEKLKANLEKENFIHQLQFQKEFEIYLELWEKINQLYIAALSLRPVVDKYDPGESENDRKKRRLEAVSQAHQELVAEANKFKPFYVPSVYEATMDLIRLSYQEVIGYQYSSPLQADGFQKYWDDAQKNAEKIIKQGEMLCEIIRKRIWIELKD
jgi:hypothetical protein